jgi:hypothetical protein
MSSAGQIQCRRCRAALSSESTSGKNAREFERCPKCGYINLIKNISERVDLHQLARPYDVSIPREAVSTAECLSALESMASACLLQLSEYVRSRLPEASAALIPALKSREDSMSEARSVIFSGLSGADDGGNGPPPTGYASKGVELLYSLLSVHNGVDDSCAPGVTTSGKVIGFLKQFIEPRWSPQNRPCKVASKPAI